MAVEARHLNIFPSQMLGNREIMNAIESNANFYNTQMGFGAPLSGTTLETLLPFYNSVIADSVPATTTTTTMKADSGLTYNLPVSRKRSRDSSNSLNAFPGPQKDYRCSSFSFLGEDISLQIQQQQLEIDWLVAQHTEKVRFEVAERRKRHSRRLVAAVEEGIMKRMKEKEEEMEKIGKLNWVLEERVKSLYSENKMWRDLAQTNEATANALRSSLEQVLAQVKDERFRGSRADEAVADDVESCCGSSDFGEDDETTRRLVDTEGERKFVKDKISSRLCRNCGEAESCVLLLPCRHLCLCTLCGSHLHTCPICRSSKTASVHVNMS